MTMPTNTKLLPWLLLLLLSVISSAPSPDNSVLFLDTGAHLRNCSCSTLVRDCDEELVASSCACRTVVVAAPPAGLRLPRRLSVWVKEPVVVGELLGSSTIAHLRLSYCGRIPASGGTLAVLGLQTLTVRAAAPGAVLPEQTVTLSQPAGVATELEDWGVASTVSHMTAVDLTVLNGRSALKSFSVLGASAATLRQHFPDLAPPPACCHSHPLLITFVY
ncbi:uncharacterized protein C21orf62 homolog [Synchiropus splendidus]|uniref:uncharacterized protein C21orf62 homolog n=1 Tax=Synchiropus splendidus TaxID=270530 RepID=UPI00237DA0A5|nr:uncharacterized protein C21orf62 homolog [Synchiropus splendidus]